MDSIYLSWFLPLLFTNIQRGTTENGKLQIRWLPNPQDSSDPYFHLNFQLKFNFYVNVTCFLYCQPDIKTSINKFHNLQNFYLYFQHILVRIAIMDTGKTWKKKRKKSSLTLYRRSQKHDDAADHDHGDNHVTTSHYKMCTTCGAQTTCSMSKIAVASVQINSKCTKSFHFQTESTSRKSVSTQYTKTKGKKNELQKEFMNEKFQDSLCQFLSRTGQLRDFLNLIKGLVEETVDPNNMAWKAVLHLGRYAACSSTTGMHYDNKYVVFSIMKHAIQVIFVEYFEGASTFWNCYIQGV